MENLNTNNKEERSNRNTRRLILLFLMLAVTGVLLTTTTYAWFTANETVTINTINVNVEAQNGIQISVDGTNWKSIIQTTDITGAIATYTGAVNQLPTSLEPVSTINAANANGRLDMFYGVVDTNDNGDYILTSTPSVETNGTTGKFVAFDIFLKVNSGVQLYMTPTSGVTADGDDSGIKNASRIAFITLGNYPDATALETVQGANTGTASTVRIWEPNYDVHTPEGVTYALQTYGVTTTAADATILPYDGVKSTIIRDNNVLLGQAKSTEYSLTQDTTVVAGTTYYTRTGANAPYTYTEVTTPATNPKAAGYYISNAGFFDPVTITYQTPAAFTNGEDDLEIFELEEGITKMRVYMWVEGQDVDCNNSASGGNIDYNIQFTIPSTQTP